MDGPVPLFVELCAGLAAVSVRLQGGRHARPPVSRMGNKAGYATAILTAMGLRPGQRAERFLWCEPDPGCRALLTAYTDPALMREAAAIIRGWKDEDPRALWERLRAEGPIREATGAEVARWAWVQGHSSPDGRLAAQYLNPDGSADGSWKAPPRDWLARRCDDLVSCLATIAPDARTVDPREVARWVWLTGRSAAGITASHFVLTEAEGGKARGLTPTHFGARLEGLPTMAATVTADARTVEPVPSLPPGTIAYMDPPYVGTTGYAADLPRAEVVRLARLWSEAGARVYISEAEPLAELDGWHRVEITAERKGQKRTFSKQQREWLTMNREPAVRFAAQSPLFGGAA